MIAAMALLAGALAAGWLVPDLLWRADLRRRDPVLLIVVWLVSMVGVLLAAMTGVILLLLPEHGPTATMFAILDHCWSLVQHGSPPRVEEAAGVLGVVLLGAVAARLAIISVRGVRRRARKRRDNLAMLRLTARSAAGPPDVLWLAHDRPLAFSMTGRPGVVVATDGLTRALDDESVAAVLSHERAHLSGRHHLLVATADALRAALPVVPLFRKAPRAIRDLVELAADVTAARDCGTAAVHTALLGMATDSMPTASLAMAQDAVALRLDRLRHGSRPPNTVRRVLSCGLAAVTAATLPLFTGIGLLLSTALVACMFHG